MSVVELIEATGCDTAVVPVLALPPALRAELASPSDLAEIAALSRVANETLIPQARHGGSGVEEAFAVSGLKFDGTGFTKLQIVHIQVAFSTGADTERDDCAGVSEVATDPLSLMPPVLVFF